MRWGSIGRVVGVAALLAVGCGSAGEEGVRGGSAAGSGWERVAAPPIGPRFGAVGAWTGDEVVVVGGRAGSSCPANADCAAPGEPGLADGAAFDPRTERWRPIAEAPVPIAEGDAVVVDGAVYVWVPVAGQPDAQAAFLRYDPAGDEWSELPLPAGDLSWYDVTAAADGIVAYPTSDEAGPGHPDRLFDPRADTWRELPADPLSPSYDRTMVDTGAGLVLLDHALVTDPNAEGPSLTRAAVLDIESGTWERLPDSEILTTRPWHVEGDLMVNPWLGGADGGEVNPWDRAYPYGGTLDLASRQWAPLPEGPGRGRAAPEVPEGQAPEAPEGEVPDVPTAGVLGAARALYTGYEGVVLDLAEREWVELPALDEPEGTNDRTVVAVGRDLFVFGGQVLVPDATEGEALGDAWLWPAPQ